MQGEQDVDIMIARYKNLQSQRYSIIRSIQALQQQANTQVQILMLNKQLYSAQKIIAQLAASILNLLQNEMRDDLRAERSYRVLRVETIRIVPHREPAPPAPRTVEPGFPEFLQELIGNLPRA